MSYKKFTENIGILGLNQLVIAVSGIIELSAITKLLGAESYGVWTQLIVTIGIIVPIAVLGLPYALVRFIAGEKNEKEIQDGFWSSFVLIVASSVLIFTILTPFSNTISRLFGCNVTLIFILPFIITLECLNQLQFNVFRAFQEIKKYTLFTLTKNMLETVLIIFVVFLKYGILGAVLSLLIIRIIFFLVMSLLIVKKIGFKFPKFLKTKEYLAFSLPSVCGSISFWVLQSSDKYFVGFLLGTLFVGYYAPAYTLGFCLTFFIAPLSFLLPPTLSKHHDENKLDEVKIYLKFSLKYFLAVAIPALFGLSALSKQLLTALSNLEIAQHSYYVIPFIASSTLLFGIYTIFGEVLSLKKKTIILGVVWFIAAILNIILNIILIPQFGILGAAIATLLGYLFATTVTCYYSCKEIQFEIDWKFISKSIISSVLMAVLIFKINPDNFSQTLMMVVLGAALYFFVIFLLKGFNKKEVEFIKGFLKK